MADGQSPLKIRSTSQQRASDLVDSSTKLNAAVYNTAISDFELRSSASPLTVHLLKNATRWVDIVTVTFCALACLGNLVGGLWNATISHALPFFALILAILSGLKVSGAYRFGYSGSVLEHMQRTALGAGLPTIVVLMAYAFFSSVVSSWFVLAAFSAWISILVLHAHYIAVFKILKRARWMSENVVIVGATENARRLIERNAESHDLNIVGVFDDRLSRAPDDLHGAPVLGRIDDLLDWEKLPYVDKIIVTVTSDARERVRFLVSRLRTLPQQVILLFDMDGFDAEGESLAKIADTPGAYVSGAPNDVSRAVWKRILDIICAAGLLLIFSPIMLAIAASIKLDTPGPIFFRQKRHGFNNQVIRVWKFRSMIANKAAEERMRAQTCANDPRVTRVGAFIRRTSLDELPQLLNVLTGEMSIVGPRPHAIGMTADAQEVHSIVSDYAHRHRVKPGITGWAQINGSRGPVHTQAEVQDRVRLDMEYINRSSVWFDLYIMLMTAPCLLGDAKRNR